ncbi:M24 family metallopeptidase [Marinobacterium jannaschii]|uniref:M24 family metallopeptidase n=1 Tax=Marinobacterium jannaschii TaxID=64970 RepID=UPI00055EB731|nr:Xaa-Pro peptidase family protein [Marinobacterium jannaschii]
MQAQISAPDFSENELDTLFDYRLARIRAAMKQQQVDLCILSNPVNLRYAVNFDEYQVFQSHIPTCYLFLPQEGPLQMHGATSRSLPGVEHYQASDFLTPFDGGLDLDRNCRRFSQSVSETLRSLGLDPADATVALERFTPLATLALQAASIRLTDAECIVERAKLIKHETEIRCMRHAIAVAELGIAQMHDQLRPGISENELWSVLHQVNIAHGGDWIEGRMLASGPRTNPWLQEATGRCIEAGDMVAFDTDLIGPMGFIADISRSWICGGGPGNAEQRAAYRHAYDEIQFNMELIRPGVSFKELSDNAFQRQPEYKANRYVCSFHGAGLSDEYPKIYYEEDWGRSGYDGIIEENMVFCVESFSGAEGAREGVKLEEMVRVTADGYEKLSTYPFESELLS